MDNQPQGNYNASSFGANIGIHTNVDNDEFSFGLGLLGSFLQPNNSENISLYAAGIYVDDYFPFNERFGAKISYGLYWRYYVNNFTVENKDYKYKKHGVMVPVLAGLYFKPTKNIFIEATIQDNIMWFQNNDKNIDGIHSTLPKNSCINSIIPSIGFRVKI